VPIALPTPYPIGPVTVYLLVGEPLTLVDTGPATGSAWRALRDALAERSLRPGDVRRVLLTHAHHDHFGLARRFARLGAAIAAHPHERENLRLARGYGLLWRQLGLAGLSVARRMALVASLRMLDRTARPVRAFDSLQDGQVLPHEGSPIRVHHMPGHTPGHVGFELGSEDAIITGDTVLDGVVPNAVINADPERLDRPFQSLAAYAATLRRLETMRPRILLPAHGPCIANVAGQVAALRERQARRSADVRAALEAGPATAAEVIARIFPRVTLLRVFLAYSEVFGHLLELERLGAVERVSERRRERWRLVR
jgi:glyoxylase-like metal-dependent hydrolase (beta-lactamase superfamily II)